MEGFGFCGVSLRFGWQNFLNAHLINEVFSTQINQMRSFSSFVRLAPMPLAIATTSVRSHGASALRTGVLLPPEDGLRQMIGSCHARDPTWMLAAFLTAGNRQCVSSMDSNCNRS